MDASLIPWIFAAIMTAGVTFLLISIFLGGFTDLDVDTHAHVNVDIHGHHFLGDLVGDLFGDHGGTSDSHNLGCMVIAAFFTGFGAIGLFGSLAGWHVFFSTLAGLAFGLIFGRSTAAVIRFVVRQESTDLFKEDSLIGARARITINVPAGKIGEAIVEDKSRMKFRVRAVGEEVALRKGDDVEIVDVREGCLYVKKKRAETGPPSEDFIQLEE